MLESYFPGFGDLVLEREVVTPLDIERTTGLTEGNIFAGEFLAPQMFFFRPAPGWSQYRTPIEGYYQCGSGTHPGGCVMGAPGKLAAERILKDKAKVGPTSHAAEWLRGSRRCGSERGQPAGGEDARLELVAAGAGPDAVVGAGGERLADLLLVWARTMMRAGRSGAAPAPAGEPGPAQPGGPVHEGEGGGVVAESSSTLGALVRPTGSRPRALRSCATSRSAYLKVASRCAISSFTHSPWGMAGRPARRPLSRPFSVGAAGRRIERSPSAAPRPAGTASARRRSRAAPPAGSPG